MHVFCKVLHTWRTSTRTSQLNECSSICSYFNSFGTILLIIYQGQIRVQAAILFIIEIIHGEWNVKHKSKTI
jgi:hypothetical protein